MNPITLSQSAVERINEIKSKNGNQQKFLRISVSSGGCNGFQYIFDLDDKLGNEDIKLGEDSAGIIAVTDEVSSQLLSGAELDFIRELGASYFKVKNPNASSNCGCGSSFNV
jgi:iron-sulfur cluster insertion protein